MIWYNMILHNMIWLNITHSSICWYCTWFGSSNNSTCVRLWTHKRQSIHQGQGQDFWSITLIARFMVPTWGPSGANRTQVSPMLSPWTYLGSFEYFGKHLRSRRYENWIDTPRQFMFPIFSAFSKSMVLCNASFLQNDDYFIPALVCEENLYRERLCRDCFYWCVGWWAIWAIMEPPEGWESRGWFNIKMPSYQDRKSILRMRRSYDLPPQYDFFLYW